MQVVTLKPHKNEDGRYNIGDVYEIDSPKDAEAKIRKGSVREATEDDIAAHKKNMAERQKAAEAAAKAAMSKSQKRKASQPDPTDELNDEIDRLNSEVERLAEENKNLQGDDYDAIAELKGQLETALERAESAEKSLEAMKAKVDELEKADAQEGGKGRTPRKTATK